MPALEAQNLKALGRPHDTPMQGSSHLEKAEILLRRGENRGRHGVGLSSVRREMGSLAPMSRSQAGP